MQPQAGKDAAAHNAISIGSNGFIHTVAQAEPVYLLLVNLKYQVFLNAVPGIDCFLLMEIITGAAGGNFDNEFRIALQIAIAVNPRSTANSRIEAE